LRGNLHQYFGDFSRIWDFTWRLSDCEEIEGLLTGDDGVGFKRYIRLTEVE